MAEQQAKERTILETYETKEQPGEVGIEVEMEGAGLPAKAPISWLATRDPSLRGESMEYVLRKPCSRGKVEEKLKTLWEWFVETGSVLSPSERCGVHIHINCQKLTAPQVMSFGCLYLLLEDLLVKWCGDDREGNLFALRAKDAEFLIKELADARKHNSFNDLQTNLFRYASINFSSLSKYGSLEFRAMRTPKEYASIVTWAKMLLRVKDASLLFPEPRNIIESLSGQGAEHFVGTVLGDLSKEVACPEMDRLVMQSVRRLQDIAYCDVAVRVKEARKKVLESKLVRNQEDRDRLSALNLDALEWDNGWPEYPPMQDIPEELKRKEQRIISGGELYLFDGRRWKYLRQKKLVDYANPPAPEVAERVAPAVRRVLERAVQRPHAAVELRIPAPPVWQPMGWPDDLE